MLFFFCNVAFIKSIIMDRVIKFRGKRVDNGVWVYGDLVINKPSDTYRIVTDFALRQNAKYTEDSLHHVSGSINDVIPSTVGQFTGVHDKDGKEIYEGDIYLLREPYRETQTHTGDNIPLGFYTEPLEPAIRSQIGVVAANQWGWTFSTDEDIEIELMSACPVIIFNLETAKDWFGGGYYSYNNHTHNREIAWDDPEEGDLQYLLETYGLDSETDLIKYLGLVVIGNIHDNPELLKS